MSSSVLGKFVCLALLGLSSVVAAYRPEGHARHKRHGPKRLHTTSNTAEVATIAAERRAPNGGKFNVGYFGNWVIYDRAFAPSDIPVSTLTHILYSFADTNPSDGTCFLTDLYSDQQKMYPDDTAGSGTNLYGNLKQFYKIKQANRGLKVVLSVGGWTYSQAGHFNFVTNPTARANFVKTAVKLLEDNGLDGIDVDYEYPATDAQAAAFAALLTELRASLSGHAKAKGDNVEYIVSAAVPAGAPQYSVLGPYIRQINNVIDMWNLMAYDYAGSWSPTTDHQANLLGGTTNTKQAIDWYVAQGATKSKINMGIPLYGRAFESTTGIQKPFTGVGSGTWEAGVYDYKKLPIGNAKVTEDLNLVASYSFDKKSGELVSYDTPKIAAQKAKFINDEGLGGAMYWELSSDKVGQDSIVGRVAKALNGLENSKNHLKYPGSQYANIKNGMSGAPDTATTSSTTASSTTIADVSLTLSSSSSGTSTASTAASSSTSASGSSSTTSAPSTTSGTTTSASSASSSSTTSAASGSSCSGVAAWSAKSYAGGSSCTYNGHLYTAKWWAEPTDVPGTAVDQPWLSPWEDKSAC